MTLDLETARWILTGIFILGGTLISWLMNREISQMDKIIESHDKRLDNQLDLINDVKQNFVSKTELKEQLSTQLSPIKDNVQEMRNNIRDMGNDIKSLLKRP